MPATNATTNNKNQRTKNMKDTATDTDNGNEFFIDVRRRDKLGGGGVGARVGRGEDERCGGGKVACACKRWA